MENRSCFPGRGTNEADPAQKIRDQFVAAFEGGSNYWIQRAALIRSDNKPTERPWYACPVVFEGSFEIELGYDDPSGLGGRFWARNS